MHEMALAERIVHIAQEQASAQGACAIRSVIVEHEWFAAALANGLRAATSPVGGAEPVCYAASGVI